MFTPKQIGFIVTAYTKMCCCNFVEFQLFAEKLLGRSIFTHEFAEFELWAELKEKIKPDFIKLAEWCSNCEENSTIDLLTQRDK